MQRVLERDARGGTRYIEILKSRFGIDAMDYRLQRPEYIGGKTFSIGANQVANTTGTDTGELGAFALGSESGSVFTTSITEHSYIIGLMSSRADLTYQKSVQRTLLKQTRWEMFEPELARIGEQEVYSGEIQWDGTATTANNLTTFGYQERYAEYRYHPRS